MKLLFIAALLLFNINHSSAQQLALTNTRLLPARQFASAPAYPGQRRHPNALITSGVSLCSGGLVLMGVGLFYTSHNYYAYNTAPYKAQQQKALNYAIGGGATILAGCILCAVGVHKQMKERLSVELVMPKNNEFGIAYNF